MINGETTLIRISLLILNILLLGFSTRAQLNWGRDCAGGEVDRHLNRVHQVIGERNMFQDISSIAYASPDGEGRLNGEAALQATRQNNGRFQSLLTVSMCARYGSEERQPPQSRCQQAASEALIRWAREVAPSGNPINDHDLLPLIMSADLLKPNMTPADRETINNWLNSIVQSGDSYMAGLQATNDVRVRMNWNTWRLATRAMAGQAMASDDPRGADIVATTRGLVDAHTHRNLNTPRNFSPTRSVYEARQRVCQGEDTSGSVSEYGSFDFRQRDALRYHNYNMLAYTQMQWFVPGAVSGLSSFAIGDGVNFLGPYVTGERVHQEFSCTTAPFDIRRRENGEASSAIRPWRIEDDRGARVMMRYSRLNHPRSHSFTNQFVTNEFTPWEKLMFSMRECETPSAPSIPSPQPRPQDT